MNLKQLKGMIAEEYRYWLAEQPVEEPGVEVGPNDIDAMGGGEDSEATLRQIYDMLKSYFEGGEAGGAMPAAPAGGEDMADMADMDAIAGGDDDLDDADISGDEDEDEEDDEEAEALQERFKKLANIIKG